MRSIPTPAAHLPSGIPAGRTLPFRPAPSEAGWTIPARADAGGAGCTFKYVEILKTRCKPDHSHPQVEILQVIGGRGLRIIGGVQGEFREGDLFVIGSGLQHTFFPSPSAPEEIRARVIQFQPEIVRPALAAFPEFHAVDAFLAAARRGLLVERGTREAVAAMMRRIGDLPPSSPRRLGLFMAILAELAESDDLAVAGGPVPLPIRAGRMDQKLDLACRLIQGNLVNPLSQSSVAGQVGMSPAAFSRWFKRHLGRPYTAYVNSARIDMVCRALLESDRDIARVGLDHGFTGEAHFHRLFKSAKGMAPAEYRRRYRIARSA